MRWIDLSRLYNLDERLQPFAVNRLPTPVDTLIPPDIRARTPEFFGDPRAGTRFHNTWEHPSLPTIADVLRWKMSPNEVRRSGYRAKAVHTPEHAIRDFAALDRSATRLFWIGHASFLLEMDDRRFVFDPIFGRAALVTPRVTPAAATPQELGRVDAVLVTHGHHDHMDPSSLAAIARENDGRTLFVVPLGMKSSMPRDCQNVVELSWWQHVQVGTVNVHFVPAQHWHQRTAFDRNRTLWGGYVVEGTHRVFHSGDTGFFGGFGAIGNVFGGIDAACLPLGAYEPTWFMGTQHMSPSQSLEAYRGLRATHFVGMHWGAFDLSNEEIEAGPRWLLNAVHEQHVAEELIHVLSPGGSVALSGTRGQTHATPQHVYRPHS